MDEVVLLGDAVELRDRPLAEALELARPFFDELGSAIGGGRVVLVPGNHDHHLLDDWLERRRLEGAGPLGLEQRVSVQSGPVAQLVAGMGRTPVELAYPGAWLRPGVYATHGHYLDRHLTVPTFERLAVAAVERVLGEPRRLRAGLAGGFRLGERRGLRAHPGARVRVPVRARAGGIGRGRLGGANPSARVWQALGGGYGRAAKLRGWLLGTVALPGAVGVANRLGLGPVRSDLSPGAITRAGLAAIGEVTRRLGIDADHLIFGHTHRRGPMRAETGWRLPEGTRLWNTGSWVYAPGGARPYAHRQPLLAGHRGHPGGRRPPSSATCSTTEAAPSSAVSGPLRGLWPGLAGRDGILEEPVQEEELTGVEHEGLEGGTGVEVVHGDQVDHPASGQPLDPRDQLLLASLSEP